MEPSAATEILKYVGLVLTGGVGVAIINWLSSRGVNRSSEDLNKSNEDLNLQKFWHGEFARLDKRIDSQDKKIASQEVEIKKLRADIKGRDVTIKNITAENERLKIEIDRMKANENAKDGIIEGLRKRVKELEDLMRRYGIDVNGKGEAK